ncbi:transmembrane protein 179B [Pholidichthys leucotaenia]
MAVLGLLVLEWALYLGCFVCGIVTAASLTIVQGNFGGLCVLYGTVNYSTANLIGVHSSSSASLCYFVSAIAVMVAVVCFSLSLYWVSVFCINGEITRERVWVNVIMAMCGFFLFFLLITGCVLKVGRDSFCSSVTSVVPNVTRCEEAETKKWASSFHGESFYSRLHSAETAVWVNFFFWIFIGVLVLLQRRQSLGSKLIPGGSAPAGSLFGDPGTTAEETEPIFNRQPSRS